MTLGVRAASIWLKVIVRYMYAALLHANVSPCAAPIGTMLCSQKRNVTCAAERGASCTPPTGVSGSSSSNSRSGDGGGSGGSAAAALLEFVGGGDAFTAARVSRGTSCTHVAHTADVVSSPAVATSIG